MKSWKKAVAGCAMIVGALCAPQAVSAAGNGYVDYNAVLAATPAVVTAQQNLVKAQQDLQTQFNTQSAKMNDKQKQELAQKLNQQLQTQEQNIQRTQLVPAIQKIRTAIEAVAKKNGVDFVVQESAWLYGGKDLTQEVIAEVKK